MLQYYYAFFLLIFGAAFQISLAVTDGIFSSLLFFYLSIFHVFIVLELCIYVYELWKIISLKLIQPLCPFQYKATCLTKLLYIILKYFTFISIMDKLNYTKSSLFSLVHCILGNGIVIRFIVETWKMMIKYTDYFS
jgi:hypothetical protein